MSSLIHVESLDVESPYKTQKLQWDADDSVYMLTYKVSQHQVHVQIKKQTNSMQADSK